MENIHIVDNGKIQLLKFNKMEEFKDKVELVIPLKTYNTGFSKNIEGKINLEEYRNISEFLKIDINNIIVPYQSHTDNILCIKDLNKIKENRPKELLNIDGTITELKNVAIATTFADCIPIFFYDPVKNVIANVHSGWVGTTKQISLKAAKILSKEYGCNINNIIVLIGPCIRKDHFFVNEDVKAIFEEKFNNLFTKYDIIEKTDMYNEKGIQYLIDTVEINKQMLINFGILKKNIIDSNICTVCKSHYFHSRRAEGKKFKLNTGIIMLK